MEKVEILDIARRRTIDTFTLSEGNKKVRIRSIEPDPLHRFVMHAHDRGDQADRIGSRSARRRWCSTTWRSTRSSRTIPWPNGEERENANIQFSPDG